MAFIAATVANTDATAFVVSSIQRGSIIHVKDTDINAITIPTAIVSG